MASNFSAYNYRSSDIEREQLTKRTTFVTVGNKTCQFSTNTPIFDDAPNPFVFKDEMDAELFTDYTSETITIDGMTPDIDISVSASGGLFAAGTLSAGSSFKKSGMVRTSSTGSIVLQLSGKSPVSADTSSRVYVRVGKVSSSWTISTKLDQEEMIVMWVY